MTLRAPCLDRRIETKSNPVSVRGKASTNILTIMAEKADLKDDNFHIQVSVISEDKNKMLIGMNTI